MPPRRPAPFPVPVRALEPRPRPGSTTYPARDRAANRILRGCLLWDRTIPPGEAAGATTVRGKRPPTGPLRAAWCRVQDREQRLTLELRHRRDASSPPGLKPPYPLPLAVVVAQVPAVMQRGRPRVVVPKHFLAEAAIPQRLPIPHHRPRRQCVVVHLAPVPRKHHHAVSGHGPPQQPPMVDVRQLTPVKATMSPAGTHQIRRIEINKGRRRPPPSLKIRYRIRNLKPVLHARAHTVTTDGVGRAPQHFSIQVYTYVQPRRQLRPHHRGRTKERLNIHIMRRNQIDDPLHDARRVLTTGIAHWPVSPNPTLMSSTAAATSNDGEPRRQMDHNARRDGTAWCTSLDRIPIHCILTRLPATDARGALARKVRSGHPPG